jgi:hypothetical protein
MITLENKSNVDTKFKSFCRPEITCCLYYKINNLKFERFHLGEKKQTKRITSPFLEEFRALDLIAVNRLFKNG